MIREMEVHDDERLLLEYISEKANDIVDFIRRNNLTLRRASLDIEVDYHSKDGTTYDYKSCSATTYKDDEVSRIATRVSNHITGKMDYMVFNYDNEEE